MLNNLNISQRISILLIAGGALIATVAALGWLGMHQMTRSLQTVYLDRAVPMVQLAKIMSLFDANYADVLRAFQHDPEGKTYSLHDHPLTEHTERIVSNQAEMDRLWAAYMQARLTREERQLAERFAAKRRTYESTIVAPALEALKRGDFSAATLSAFLKGNRAIGGETRSVLEELIAYQARVAKAEFEAAESTYKRNTILFVGIFILGILGLSLFAWALVRSITRPLQQAVRIAEAVAQGDLSQAAPEGGKDEVGRLLAAMRHMQLGLRGILSDLRRHADDLDRTANELAASAQSSAQASTLQSEAASSTAAAVEELSVAIDQVRESAREARQMSTQSGEQARAGSSVVHEAGDEIGKIAEAVNATARSIDELENVSKEISSIVAVIKEVADQTNLLALNAAIEAARAGEQGRGFAVVADEVRKLAERTGESTLQIAQMIDRIQSGTSKAAAEMEASVSRVQKGVSLAHAAGDSVAEIQSSTERALNSVDDIARALDEQSAASQEIAKNVERIAQMAEANNAVVAQTRDAAQELQSQASRLSAIVARFRF